MADWRFECAHCGKVMVLMQSRQHSTFQQAAQSALEAGWTGRGNEWFCCTDHKEMSKR